MSVGAGVDSQLALDDERTSADNLAGGVLNDKNKVGALLLGEEVVALDEGGLSNVANRRQDAQAVEETGSKVRGAERANAIPLGELGGDLGANEVITKQSVGRHFE